MRAYSAEDASFVGIPSEAPTAKRLEVFYEDSQYKFVGHGYGKHGEDGEAAFYAFGKGAQKWVRIAKVSTRDAVLGRSPDFPQVMIPVNWDYAQLKERKYVDFPLHTSGSILFPDKIEYDEERGVFRLSIGSRYGKHAHPTIFYIQRSDLDVFFAKERN